MAARKTSAKKAPAAKKAAPKQATKKAAKQAAPKKSAKKAAAKKSAAKKAVKKSVKKSAGGKWALPLVHGKTFVFSGTPRRSSRADAEKLVRAEGGKVSKSVTAAADYLISTTDKHAKPSAAEQKAESRNQSGKADITILNEDAFHQLFVRDREEAIALLKSGSAGVKRWNESSGQQWLQARSDLSQADFRKCDLRKARLQFAKLDRCDFRGAQLESAVLGKVKDAKFDEASVHVTSIEQAHNCSFRNLKPPKNSEAFQQLSATDSMLDGAPLRSLHTHRLVGCSAKDADCRWIHFYQGDVSGTDFSGANLEDASGFHTNFAGCRFDKATLREADLDRSKFPGASFRQADLSDAMLEKCDFSAADLTGAKLEKIIAHSANFQNANLSQANLRGATLKNADFTGAELEGADFTGAYVAGAQLSPAQIAVAKGLEAGSTAAPVLGPNLQQLDKVSQNSSKLSIDLRVDRQDAGPVFLNVESWQGRWNNATEQDGKTHRSLPGNNHSVSDCLLALARRWDNTTPCVHELKVSSTRCMLRKKPLQALAMAAWCEAFGLDIPTEDDLKQRAKQAAQQADALRDEALAELRQGPAGVKKWNRLTTDERKAIRNMRRVDLSAAQLQKINLREFDLQGADFSKADLRKARLDRADLKKANFTDTNAQEAKLSGAKANDVCFKQADLTNARLHYVSLLRADFTGAKLSGAELDNADLRGANFTDASLEKASLKFATFDDKTVFPTGHVLSDDMIWRGEGKDPRLAAKVEKLLASGPVDFEAFMKQLEKNFDQARLKKALKMLKADSFQLFADVQSDSMTGVVKSQSDASLVYSCRLDAEGAFACCTQNLNHCGGLRGALCKHLLVLIVGLTKGEEIDPTIVNSWVAASKMQAPQLDKDLMSEVFLKYKGAEAGEIDWRPTETVPEDYYAF